MQMALKNLFPIPLLHTQLNHNTKSLISMLTDDLHPVKGQTKNTHILNELIEFKSLRNDIVPILRVFMRDVLRIDGEPHITQSWANRSEPGQSHHEHSHQNSFISAVFYLNAPKGSSINFHRASQNAHTYTMMPSKLPDDNDYTASIIEVPVETNDLIIFPSYVLHSVGPNFCDEDRWSLALNCVTENVIGNNSKLNELRIF